MSAPCLSLTNTQAVLISTAKHLVLQYQLDLFRDYYSGLLKIPKMALLGPYTLRLAIERYMRSNPSSPVRLFRERLGPVRFAGALRFAGQ